MEETWRFKQEDIAAATERGAANKIVHLDLPELGPYKCAFSRSGRHMVLGGARGHLAVMEWQRAHLTCEVQVRYRWSHGVDQLITCNCMCVHPKHCKEPATARVVSNRYTPAIQGYRMVESRVH